MRPGLVLVVLRMLLWLPRGVGRLAASPIAVKLFCVKISRMTRFVSAIGLGSNVFVFPACDYRSIYGWPAPRHSPASPASNFSHSSLAVS